jgi:hypothetical protein
MTIPSERTHAVLATRNFMLDLLRAKDTPRVPRAIRERALRCLRHYPGEYEMERVAAMAPESWGMPE